MANSEVDVAVAAAFVGVTGERQCVSSGNRRSMLGLETDRHHVNGEQRGIVVFASTHYGRNREQERRWVGWL